MSQYPPNPYGQYPQDPNNPYAQGQPPQYPGAPYGQGQQPQYPGGQYGANPPGGYIPQYQSPYFQPNPRPGSVTAMAVIGIVLASLGLLCGVVSIFPFISDVGQANPVIREYKRNSALWTFMLVEGAIRFILNLMLMCVAIGALGLKSWARTGFIAYAIALMVMLVVGLIGHFTILMPGIEKALDNVGAVRNSGFQAGSNVGVFIGIALGAAYAICALAVFTRPNVAAAFANKQQ